MCIRDRNITIASMDFSYIGGSMGSVVGEKISRAVDHSINTKSPLLIISKSGGARMMEGAISLMQMAKTSAKLTQLSNKKIPYISLSSPLMLSESLNLSRPPPKPYAHCFVWYLFFFPSSCNNLSKGIEYDDKDID